MSALDVGNVNGFWTLEIYGLKKRKAGKLKNWSIIGEAESKLFARDAPETSTRSKARLTVTVLTVSPEDHVQSILLAPYSGLNLGWV